jgi:hypothetical protein
VLRIGRERVELWRELREGVVLDACAELAAPNDSSALHAALVSLFAQAAGDRPRRVAAVLESAWMPVMHLDVRASLWAPAQVEALLRHRVMELYGERGGEPNNWLLQLDYRAGASDAVGYALTPTIKEVVVDAVAAAGRRCVSVMPAFLWGWKRLRGDRQSGWWCWTEQDRLLAAYLCGGRLLALNPAASLPQDATGWQRLAPIEAARLGIAGPQRVTVASWAGPSDALLAQTAGHVAWHSVAAAPKTAGVPMPEEATA